MSGERRTYLLDRKTNENEEKRKTKEKGTYRIRGLYYNALLFLLI